MAFALGNEPIMDILTCIQCHGDGDLVFLSCLHSLCQDCVKKCEDGVYKCGECDIETAFNPSEPLKANFLQPVSKVASSFKKPRSCFMCLAYDRKTTATHLCFECGGDQLCSGCLKPHETMPATQSHTPVPLVDISDEMIQAYMARKPTFCPKHSEPNPQLLLLYCESCETKVCNVCVFNSHTGKEHHIIRFEDIVNEQKAKFRGRIQPLQEAFSQCTLKIFDLKKNQEKRAQKKEQVASELEKRAKTVIEDIQRNIKAWVAGCKEKLENHCDDLDAQEREQLQQLTSLKKGMTNFIALSQEYIKLYPHLNSREKDSFMVMQSEKTKELAMQVGFITGRIQTTDSFELTEPKRQADRKCINMLLGHISFPREDGMLDTNNNKTIDVQERHRSKSVWCIHNSGLDRKECRLCPKYFAPFEMPGEKGVGPIARPDKRDVSPCALPEEQDFVIVPFALPDEKLSDGRKRDYNGMEVDVTFPTEKTLYATPPMSLEDAKDLLVMSFEETDRNILGFMNEEEEVGGIMSGNPFGSLW